MARGAATEVHRVEGAEPGCHLDLGNDRIRIALDQVVGAGHDSEVAVRANRGAEGDVDVGGVHIAEGVHGGHWSSSTLSAATNASWGTSTEPTIFIRFLPSFCFWSSFFFRVTSPP